MKGKKMLDQKKTVNTNEFDQFIVVAKLYLENKITHTEFVGLIPMLNSPVANDFIAKAGN